MKHDPWLRRALYLITGCFALRLIIAATIPLDLVHDEAYYWEWARRLDWCYYSKPPMVAWLIAASTSLLGDSSFAVRLPAVVLGTWSAWFVFLLARDMYGSRVGFWAAALLLAAPGSAALGLLMTIDAPLLFCWSVALFAFWRLLQRDRHRTWWLGCVILAIGIGLLSKQTMLGFIPLAGLFLIASREDRQELVRPALWICCLVSLCFLAPVVWWNVHNGWVTLEHTSGHFGDESVTIWKRCARGFEFMGALSGVASPPTSWLFCFAAAVALARFPKCGRRERFLLMFSAIPLIAVTALAFKQRVEPNWPAPICIAGVIFVSGSVLLTQTRRLVERGKDRRLAIALGTAIVATTVTYTLGYGVILKGSKLDAGLRMRGWSQLGGAAGEVLQQFPGPDRSFLVVTNGRAYASELAFYMPQHPQAFVWNSSGVVVSQYDVWGGPRGSAGHDALIVTDGPEIPQGLARCFDRIEPLPQVRVPIGNGSQLSVRLWRGVSFDQEVAIEVAGFGERSRGQYAGKAQPLRR